MSRIDDLIRELCPEGTEYVPLGKIAQIGTGKSDRKDADGSGQFPFFVRSKKVLCKDTFDFEEEAVLIPGEGGIGEIFHYVNGRYALHQRAYRIVLSTATMTTRFLLFYLRSQFKAHIVSQAVNGTVSSVRKPMIERFLVPIPPLPVQEEIVRILDTFTDIEAELEAELEARTTQYEETRNRLMDFDAVESHPLSGMIRELCPEGTEYVPLGKVAQIGTGKSDRKDADESGQFPFFVRSKTVLYKDTFDFDEEAVLIPGEGGIGDIFHYVNGRYALHQRAYRIVLSTATITTRFLLFYLRSQFKTHIVSQAVNGTVSSIRKPMIERFLVPIPPLPVQEEIVRILDTFDSLVNDLSIGLPAEIAARRKQYEYYRDKLLTFEERAA